MAFWNKRGKADKDLLAAAASGDVARIKKALEKGANIEARDSGHFGYTPLALAAYKNHPSAVIALLDAGAKIDARMPDRYNHTPLHVASINNNATVVQVLLDRGADINAIDGDGETPLHNAVYSKKTEALAELLRRGADQSIVNKKGRTAAGVAQYNGYNQLYDLLGVLLAAPAAPLPKQPEPLPPANDNADEVVFFRRHGNRILEETFNFSARERISLIRNGMDGPVEAMTRDSFDTLGDKAALRHAFEIYKSKGGKLEENDLFPQSLDKAKIQPRTP